MNKKSRASEASFRLREEAMRQEQCERVFTDKIRGKRFDRPGFHQALDVARAGDVIVVWRLNRLGRSLKQLIETVTMLGERGIELRSLEENIDTTPTEKAFDLIYGSYTDLVKPLPLNVNTTEFTFKGRITSSLISS